MTTSRRTTENDAPGRFSGALCALRFVGKILLILYFVAGALIILSRWVVTVELEKHLDDYEQLLSQATGIDIRAEHMDAGFTLLRPVLTLRDVSLARPGGPVALRLPEIQAEFAWSSLWHLSLRFHSLVISDPTLTIRRTDESTYDIAGLTVSMASVDPVSAAAAAAVEKDGKDRKSSPAQQPVTAWLLAQGRVHLKNGTIRYIDERVENPQPVSLEGVNVAFEQRLLDYRAAVSGSVVVDGEAKTFDLRARVEKHLFTRNDDPLTWRGEAYANLEAIDYARLLSRAGLGRFMSKGRGAARLWARFDSGRITSLTSGIRLADVNALFWENLQPLRLPELSGRFEYTDNGRETSFHAHNFTFRTFRAGRFGPAELSADCTRDDTGELNECTFGASQVSIGTLSRIATSLPIPPGAVKFLTEKTISGTLRNVSATVKDDFEVPSNWRVSGHFTGLSLTAGTDGLPGFRNISGTVRTRTTGEIDVELATHYGALYFPGIFRDPKLDLSKLTGLVTVTLDPQVRIDFQQIVVQNEDGHATGEGSWTATGGPGTLDIHGTLERANGAAVHKYLPNVIGDAALDYVVQSVISGRASKGEYVVRGELARYPWVGEDAGKGLFRITGEVERGSMDIFPSGRRSGKSWARGEQFPVLTNIRGRMIFEGDRMTIIGDSGECGKLSASNVKVEIPSFFGEPPVLTVEGDIRGDLSEGLGYLTRTPFLANLIGTPFAESKASGAVEAHLSLNIPLDEGHTPYYAVNASVTNGTFRYLPILPEIRGLSGSLSVSSKGISSPRNFTGSTAAGPVTAAVSTKNNRTIIDIDASASAADLRTLTGLPELDPLLRHVTGTASVSAEAQIPLSGGAPLRITATSSLAGLTSALPEPLAKTASARIPARVALEIGGGTTSLAITASPLFTLDLGWEKNVLTRGFIGAGAERRSVKSGIELAVRSDTLDLSRWSEILGGMEFAGALADPSDGTGTSAAGPKRAAFTRAEIYSKAVSWEGSPVGGIDALWRRTPTGWTATAEGGLAAGSVTWLDHVGSRPAKLTAKLRRLAIPADEEKETDTAVKPAAENASAEAETGASGLLGTLNTLPLFPDLDVTIEDLHVGARAIGRVEAVAANRTEKDGAAGWNLSKLTIRNKGATVTGTGSWRRTAKDPAGITSLTGNVDVRDAGEMLTSLGVRDALHNAPGTMSVNFSWAGRPSAFNLATLSGSMIANAGAGQILQVEPGAGRLLSLLSMQHLLRRLTLDFRDVVAKGFFFDSFTTDCAIENGIVRVKRSTFVGSSAAVVIDGDVDLVNSLIDLEALVLPSINAEGASLALAIANPAVGIGTLIAQWLLKDQISSLLSTLYEVKGPMDDPVISKVDRRARSQTQRNATSE
ncbi:YhdP family protein [Sutterella sp.]|uniref:YhdP family protein n=1 Tax=Sutterella sp. TaxID=1981025 RepID=UPI0026DFE11B|nr:YhdP family protein [Sutterella sp.]MDO5530654.1 YhdP family protein [Sutterella sp.]